MIDQFKVINIKNIKHKNFNSQPTFIYKVLLEKHHVSYLVVNYTLVHNALIIG